MTQWPDDVRLLAAIATNALMLAASWRLASRLNRRIVIALPDALLFWIAAQYVITGVCGMLGVLTSEVLLLTGCLCSVATIIACAMTSAGLTASSTPTDLVSRPARRESIATLLALTFAIAYAGATFFNQRWLPQLATDALVYHTPAAAQWLANGRIGLVDFWYWLPDNTYSPLAGSVWIAWWLAPIGNDSLSRFVQFPVWLLLFSSLLRLLRDLRVTPWLAALVSLTIVLSRPFISQLVIAKDDIAVAALAVTLLGAMHSRRLREPGAAVRIGIALGLLMSVKYTAALAVPVLLPAIALFPWKRFGFAQSACAAGIAIAFVAPWLIRNALLTGNPFFPIGSGGTSYLPDPNLRSLSGLYQTLAGSHHALPIALWIIGVVTIVWTTWIGRQMLVRDPTRLCIVLGPPLAIVLLVLLFPFSEIRYLFTALAVGLLSIGLALNSVRPRGLAIGIALAVLAVSLGTSFNTERLAEIATFTLAGAVASAIVFACLTLLAIRVRTILAAAAALGLCVAIYINWRAYLRHPDAGYERSTDQAWIERYGEVAAMWATLRANVPAGSTVAYVNTPTIWPLFGFDRQFRVVYAPVRPGIHHLHDLPRVDELVPARDEYLVATAHLNEGADASTWLGNLANLKADYLFVAKHESSDAPPELRFIAGTPARFERMSENDAAVIFRVRR